MEQLNSNNYSQVFKKSVTEGEGGVLHLCGGKGHSTLKMLHTTAKMISKLADGYPVFSAIIYILVNYGVNYGVNPM